MKSFVSGSIKRIRASRVPVFLTICAVLCRADLLWPQSYRDSWQQPVRILDSLRIEQGMKIGEVGAGGGYFTFHLSRRVGESGHVYANDIDRSGLSAIERRCKSENILNITTILGRTEDPLFPVQMDLLIMMLVFHDLERPVEFLSSLPVYLKPGGRLVIIDRDPDKYAIDRTHFMSKERVLELIGRSVFEVEKVETFLPRDNIYICVPRSKTGDHFSL